MSLRLYDLAGAQPERRFSPYCWRIRLALAHKSLPVETYRGALPRKPRLRHQVRR
jgi:Glutathione S-transferase, N-terminal domain